MARVLRAQEHLGEAEKMFREVLAGARSQFGEDHPHTLSVMFDLAGVLMARENLAGAEPLLRSVLVGRRSRFTDQHPVTIQAMYTLASCLCRDGAHPAAEALYDEARRIADESLPAGHYVAAVLEFNYGGCMIQAERFDEAESHLLEHFPAIERQLGADHHATLRARKRIVELYERWGKPEKADEYRAKNP